MKAAAVATFLLLPLQDGMLIPPEGSWEYRIAKDGDRPATLRGSWLSRGELAKVWTSRCRTVKPSEDIRCWAVLEKDSFLILAIVTDTAIDLCLRGSHSTMAGGCCDQYPRVRHHIQTALRTGRTWEWNRDVGDGCIRRFEAVSYTVSAREKIGGRDCWRIEAATERVGRREVDTLWIDPRAGLVKWDQPERAKPPKGNRGAALRANLVRYSPE